MKTCPTCQTSVFEDMAVCYSCLHRFGEGGAAEVLAGDEGPSGSPGGMRVNADALDLDECFLEVDDVPPALVAPSAGAAAPEWVIRLEMRNEEHPQRVWSMELNPANWAALEVA